MKNKRSTTLSLVKDIGLLIWMVQKNSSKIQKLQLKTMTLKDLIEKVLIKNKSTMLQLDQRQNLQVRLLELLKQERDKEKKQLLIQQMMEIN